MAVLNIDFYSKQLKMSTVVTVIAPDSVRIGDTPVSKRKCLWLLHGLSDDGTSPLRFSKVELYALETGVVVVMPSVGRSMYCDGINGQNYFSLITEELPEYLELLMGLPRGRESNYIAGISMGGLGAARIALTYPERFTAVGLFSGLLNLKMLMDTASEERLNEFPFLAPVKSDPDGSPLNPVNLLNAERHAGLGIKVYCGLQDDLYPMSVSFCERAKALGLGAEATFVDGAHHWRFWDTWLDKFIKEMAGA